VLLFGSSTWGLGDLQDDWGSFIKTVASADLSSKKISFFRRNLPPQWGTLPDTSGVPIKKSSTD
jgi:flavodoxin